MTRIEGPRGWVCPECHGHPGLDHKADCEYEARQAEEDARTDAEEFLGDRSWRYHWPIRNQEIVHRGGERAYDRRQAERDRERERSE